MKQSMSKGDVVDRTLSSLGIRFKALSYDEEKEIFVTKMDSEFEFVEVKFVLVTATRHPTASSSPSSLNQEQSLKGRPPKRIMQNLLIVHRDSLEKLGIFFEESELPSGLVKGDLE